MISETTNLDSLIRTLDKLQVQRQPLKPHAIKDLAEPDKILYATLLVMLMTNQPITENQTRLLGMLLSCMGLEDDLQPLYANIPNIDKNSVLAFCELCDANDLAVSFLMDALTLCRLDNPLSDAQSKSLSELVNLLELDATTLTDVLHLSNTVLGEEVEISADTDDETITTLTKVRLDFDYDKLKPWHEFGYQPLRDEEQLTKELDGGKWLVDKPLHAYSAFSLSNATVLFSSQASLTVDVAEKNERSSELIKFNNCQVIQANMNFIGKPNNNLQIKGCNFINSSMSIESLNINIVNSIFTGDKIYNHSQNYLSLEKFNVLIVNSCIFKNCPKAALLTKGYGRNFWGNNEKSNISITNSIFNNCGNSELDHAGAIIISEMGELSLNIEKCDFIDNKSQNGSDIKFNEDWVSEYKEIKIQDSNFTNNDVALRDFIKSIFAKNIENTNLGFTILNSKFQNTSILVTFYNYNSFKIFNKVSFVNTVVLSNTDREDLVFDQCTFKNPDNQKIIEYNEA